MAVSGGYPGIYEKGLAIDGLDQSYGKQSIVFHAGTVIKDGTILTSGGRVFCVTSYGESLAEAVDTSLDVMQYIKFEDMYYRSDIGFEFVSQNPAQDAKS